MKRQSFYKQVPSLGPFFDSRAKIKNNHRNKDSGRLL